MERTNKRLLSIHPRFHFSKFLPQNGTGLFEISISWVFMLLFLVSINLKAGEVIKIMPVGNSITAGEHYGFPALEERTGYRKDLYTMLIDSGYNVDFVGSQKHGERCACDTNWYDWNNEAYPGWRIPAIAAKMPEALHVYKPDILLVHVGTNGSSPSDWPLKPGQVMTMLDSINKYSVDNDHPITVFLCQIINRFISEDQSPTSLFNVQLADTVANRTGDSINIILVDMEKGIGLDYSDSLPDPTANPPYEGGDMWGTRYPETTLDKFHPNDKGNTKMAVKLYEELVKEIDPPQTIENNKVEDVKLIAVSESSIKITWTGNYLDEDGYIIERAKPGSEFSIVDTANANTRCLINRGVDATNEYVYRIKAFNATRESLPSSEVSYIPSYYTLTTTVIGQGSVNPSSGSYLAGPNHIDTLEAVPSHGWEFDIWSGDITAFYKYTNPIAINIDSDKMVTANFVEITKNVSTETKSLFRFYPNPVSDEFIINMNNYYSGNASLTLINSLGKLVLRENIIESEQVIEMRDLPGGIYFISVTCDQGNLVRKIFKNN